MAYCWGPCTAENKALKSGDKGALRLARTKLSKSIKEVKRHYAQKINNHFFDTKNAKHMWQGIQALTDYKVTDACLPNMLTNFYARFEAYNSTQSFQSKPTPEKQVLCLTPADVRKMLSRVNPQKAVGPDNVPGRVLRDCANQLADVLTDILNTSMSQTVVRYKRQKDHHHSSTKEVNGDAS